MSDGVNTFEKCPAKIYIKEIRADMLKLEKRTDSHHDTIYLKIGNLEIRINKIISRLVVALLSILGAIIASTIAIMITTILTNGGGKP